MPRPGEPAFEAGRGAIRPMGHGQGIPWPHGVVELGSLNLAGPSVRDNGGNQFIEQHGARHNWIAGEMAWT